MRLLHLLVAPCALVVAAGSAAAQTPAAPATPPVEFTADLGYVTTSGNSTVTTLTASDIFKFTNASWAYTQTFAVVYGTVKDSVQTSKWRAGVRAERSFSDVIGAYALVNYDKDRFAGIEGRWEEGVGAAIKTIASPTDKLDVEIGISAIQAHPTAGLPDNNFLSGRTRGTYRHSFSEKRYVQQVVEYLPNLQSTADWRMNSETALVAPVSSHIGLKVAYVITFQHLPPAGFGDTDRLFSTSLQISF